MEQIATLQQFADLLNRTGRWDASFDAIIARNGWDGRNGPDDEICNDGTERLVLNDEYVVVVEKVKRRRGGHRDGAGRKPKADRKVAMCIYVRRETADWLRSRELPPGNVIDSLVGVACSE